MRLRLHRVALPRQRRPKTAASAIRILGALSGAVYDEDMLGVVGEAAPGRSLVPLETVSSPPASVEPAPATQVEAPPMQRANRRSWRPPATETPAEATAEPSPEAIEDDTSAPIVDDEAATASSESEPEHAAALLEEPPVADEVSAQPEGTSSDEPAVEAGAADADDDQDPGPRGLWRKSRRRSDNQKGDEAPAASNLLFADLSDLFRRKPAQADAPSEDQAEPTAQEIDAEAEPAVVEAEAEPADDFPDVTVAAESAEVATDTEAIEIEGFASPVGEASEDAAHVPDEIEPTTIAAEGPASDQLEGAEERGREPRPGR